PYKTSSVVDDFKVYKNFTYIPNQLVTSIKDKKSYAEIESYSIDKSTKLKTYGKYLILAAGSINTTRIVLKSLNLYNYKTTFLTKAHYMTACIQPNVLFQKRVLNDSKSGQLVISSKGLLNKRNPFFIQFYRFNPTAIDKVLKYIPLPKFIASSLLSTF